MPDAPPPKRFPYNQWCPAARALDLVGDKWTLLIIRDLAAGPRRFVALRRVLPGISTDQLRLRLNRLVADGLLSRKRYREAPPRVEYALTERGRALMPVLGELAHWGYRWAWGPPTDSEVVELGALFRLAPALIEPNVQAATAEFAVEDEAERSCYALTITADSVRVQEREVPNADVRVRGTRSAWVRALSPEPDHGSLEIAGRRELAEQLLASIGGRLPAT